MGSGPADVGRIIEAGKIRPVFQPIVSLERGEIVGYEAFAGGPKGSTIETPSALYTAARNRGLVAALDAVRREAALRGALAARLRPPASLFVNVDPAGLNGGLLAHPETLHRAHDELKVIVEISERDLAARPAEILVAAEHIRADGWGIAVEDLFADRRALALLPLLRPDVVKLDMRHVRAPGHTADAEASAEVVAAVARYTRATGAHILATGIDEPEHEIRARHLGTSLGQGSRFGRPERLSRSAASRMRPGAPLFGPQPPIGGNTPAEIAFAEREPEIAAKAALLAISRRLEERALALREPAVVLGTFQSAARFAPATAARYAALARQSEFVAVFGEGVKLEPAPGVRGASLDAGEVLAGEWDVIVVAGTFAGALIARDLGDGGPDLERRFAFTVTHDRALVLRAARSLMLKIGAQPAPPRLAVPA